MSFVEFVCYGIMKSNMFVTVISSQEKLVVGPQVLKGC